NTAIDAKANTGFYFGGGTEIAAGARGAFDISFRYLLSDLDADFSITDTVTGISSSSESSYDMNMYIIDFGYTFSF
ncbi:hypothetical protein ACFLU6_10465, partial [Acidobacteriota bacterium]